ncbi:MAG: hypothetical protein PHG39_02310 [Acidithiobacillus ferrooxidans]|nr:hypothetical protein [Acidithiobacillus ferrooxidans]MDD5003131.1 hypothetical protein [Acidithiobacillus sp.]MDD5379507.1 hypothetical protein [Acidithiobacillus sp.]MDD5576465.1 hypothetical protein [Acidithiobacillus sp.]
MKPYPAMKEAEHEKLWKQHLADIKRRYPKPKRHDPLGAANKAKAEKKEEQRLFRLAYTRIEQAQDALRYGDDNDVRLALEAADHLLSCLLY